MNSEKLFSRFQDRIHSIAPEKIETPDHEQKLRLLMSNELDDEVVDPGFIADYSDEIKKVFDLLSNNEEARKPVMELDARSSAWLVTKEWLSKESDIRATIISSLANLIIFPGTYAKNCNFSEFSPEGKHAICELYMNGIFDCMNIKEEDRPYLRTIDFMDDANPSNDPQNNSAILGEFRHPSKNLASINPRAATNGMITLCLETFKQDDKFKEMRDTLAILTHECFHVWQFKLLQLDFLGGISWGDNKKSRSYAAGWRNYICPDQDIEGYENQGYESSANIFSDDLNLAVVMVFDDAIKEAERIRKEQSGKR